MPSIYRYGNNPSLCSNGNSCQTTRRKSKLAIYIAVPVVLVVVTASVVLLLCFLLKRRKRGDMHISFPARSSNFPIPNTEPMLVVCVTASGPASNAVKPQNETPSRHAPAAADAYSQSSLQFENRRFSYRELEVITNNFQRVLGRGGFGSVYDGFLEDGTQVAVKLRSDSSNQGDKEFLAEVGMGFFSFRWSSPFQVEICSEGLTSRDHYLFRLRPWHGFITRTSCL